MRQRLTVLFLVFGIVLILVGLNALTYVQTQKEADSELKPNRSTYNSGATGTQAFFALLSETGRRPVRWQDSPDGLTTNKNKPDVFVMIGQMRRDITENETTALMRWVSQGGKLVVIDREPPKELCATTSNWKLTISSDPAVELLSVDPADQGQMIDGAEAAKPVQPSIFTKNVSSVQPSRFAGSVTFERSERENSTSGDGSGLPVNARELERPTPEDSMDTGSGNEDGSNGSAPLAPVVHVAGNQKNILVDVPYGSGRIIYLTDPFIVSNSGIGIVDNAQLALNIVASPAGTIAFDEYHQGYGSNANRLFQYFEGTPIIAIFVQALLLIGLVFISQSRRFARPVPEAEPDRLSKLEYIGAMAELQLRTRAYDLAIENIYTDFRRRATRALGLDNTSSSRSEISLAIADRLGIASSNVSMLMAQCEAIIQGEPTNKTATLELTAKLREMEEKLNIGRGRRGKATR
jgi:hypothetical protein